MAVGTETVTGPVGRSIIGSSTLSGNGNPFVGNLVYRAPLTSSLSTAYTDPTFTRAAAGYYSPSSFKLLSAATNAPRFENSSLLMESATSTQYLLYNNLLNEDWAGTPTWALSANLDEPSLVSGGGPGGQDAWEITATAGGSAAYVGQDIGANAANSSSVWVKAGTSTAGHVLIGKDNAATAVAESGRITLTDEWQKITIAHGEVCDTMLIFPHWDHVLGTASAGDSILVSFPCMFNDTFATSELLSTSATTTRASDKLVVPAGFSPEVLNNFGIALWIKRDGQTGSFQTVFKYQGETGNRTLYILDSGAIQALYGGATQTSGTTPFSDNGWHRILYTGNATTYQVYVDGTQVLTQTIGTASGTHTSIDFNHNNTLFAHLRDITIYNKHFSATEAQEEYLNA